MQLYAQRPLAVSAWRMQRDAWKSGYNYSQEEIAAEVDFLEGEKLVERVAPVGVSEIRFKVTSAGVKHYEGAQ